MFGATFSEFREILDISVPMYSSGTYYTIVYTKCLTNILALIYQVSHEQSLLGYLIKWILMLAFKILHHSMKWISYGLIFFPQQMIICIFYSVSIPWSLRAQNKCLFVYSIIRHCPYVSLNPEASNKTQAGVELSPTPPMTKSYYINYILHGYIHDTMRLWVCCVCDVSSGCLQMHTHPCIQLVYLLWLRWDIHMLIFTDLLTEGQYNSSLLYPAHTCKDISSR